jgi:hypothetical protein
MTKDVALQQAKLSYLQNSDQLHSHPYFWAGFVTIGKTAPIPSPLATVSWNSTIYIILAILLIICGLLILKNRVFFSKKRIKH